MNLEICMGKQNAVKSYCISILGTERVKVSLFLGACRIGHLVRVDIPRAPKLWWSASKQPFAKWASRHPNGRTFLAKEISGFLHLRFKPYAILGSEGMSTAMKQDFKFIIITGDAKRELVDLTSTAVATSYQPSAGAS